AVAGLLHARRYQPRRQAAVLALSGLVAGVLAGCVALPWDEPDRWLSYHCMTLTWAVLALGVVAVGSWVRHERLLRLTADDPKPLIFWLAVLGTVLGLAAARGLNDPALPWVPGTAALAASLVLAAPAVWFGQTRFA